MWVRKTEIVDQSAHFLPLGSARYQIQYDQQYRTYKDVLAGSGAQYLVLGNSRLQVALNLFSLKINVY